MAIENDIQDLTASIKALTAAVLAGNQVVVSGEPIGATKVETVKKTAEKAASTTAKATATATEAASPSEPEVDLTTDTAPEVTYEQLAAKFTELVTFNRPRAVEILQEYSLGKLAQATEDKWAEIFQKVSDALA